MSPSSSHDTNTNRQRLIAAVVPVIGVSLLILLKTFTAVWTGSLAVTGSLIDSVMDLVASTTNFLAIRHSQRPPDWDHSWGHGKAESLSSLVQTALVLVSAAALVWQSVLRFLDPTPLTHTGAGIAVMGVSFAMSVFLTWYLRASAKKFQSSALRADSTHYLSDILTNLATVAALLAFEKLGWAWLDPVVSVAIALVLAKSAYNIGTTAIDELMDRELPKELRKQIVEVAVKSSPHIFGIHELRTRRSGRTTIVDLHLEIRSDLSFLEVHAITNAVETAIHKHLGAAIVTIHPDPYLGPQAPLDDTCVHTHT